MKNLHLFTNPTNIKLTSINTTKQNNINTIDRPDLRQVSHIQRLNMFISKSLRAELNKIDRHPYDNSSVYDMLISKIPTLRNLTSLHMEALSKFKKSRNIEFPALHRELFSLDISE